MSDTASEPAATERPILRIVRGEPTPEELAIITAVMTAAGSVDAPAPEPPTRGRWNDPSHSVRRYWAAGPGGWRATAR